MMKSRIACLLFLLAIVSLVASREWFQQGHTNFLTSENFDQAVNQPNKFKYVKFFTQSCGYCRKLKYVQEELLQEKQWSFEMYDVDCTSNSQLCKMKAPFIDSYPFVVIYNIEGGMEASLNGYYPYETMKGVFSKIEALQEQALLSKEVQPKAGISTQVPSSPQEAPTKKEEQVNPPVTPKIQIIAEGTLQEKSSVETTNSTKKEEGKKSGEESSWREGVKIAVMLLGVWMWDKMVAPYLKSFSESAEKSRIIEIPVGGSRNEVPLAKKDEECATLLSDNL